MTHIHIRETTDFVRNILKSVPLPSGKAKVSNDGDNTSGVGLKGWIPQLPGLKDSSFWVGKCVSYLYIYKNDGTGKKTVDNKDPTNRQITAKLFVLSKEKQKFLATHGLKQWWPSDAELMQVIDNRKRTSGQLRYLYTSTRCDVTHLLNLPSVSLAMSLSHIGEREEFVWKWNSLRFMLPSSNETPVSISNDRGKTSDAGLKSWIPQLSGLKDAGFAVGKWISQLYAHKSNVTAEKMDTSQVAQGKPS